MSERIELFETIDELLDWATDKIRTPGGWFDAKNMYLVVSSAPIMIAVEEMRK
jgi:hypothetical protein